MNVTLIGGVANDLVVFVLTVVFILLFFPSFIDGLTGKHRRK